MTDKTKMGSRIGLIGGWFSLLYLIATAVLLVSRWTDLKQLQLNELGDCLAGIFGPLAILWLVLGFFQQGIELRQNSDALRMQAQELRNSVEQQSELVKVAQAQLESDRAALDYQRKLFDEQEREAVRKAQPLLKTSAGGSHGGDTSTHDIHIKNYGAVCRNISLKALDTDLYFSPSQYPILDQNDRSLKFSVELPSSHEDSQFLAEINFLDARGNMQKIPCQGFLRRESGSYYQTMRIELPEV